MVKGHLRHFRTDNITTTPKIFIKARFLLYDGAEAIHVSLWDGSVTYKSTTKAEVHDSCVLVLYRVCAFINMEETPCYHLSTRFSNILANFGYEPNSYVIEFLRNFKILDIMTWPCHIMNLSYLSFMV